MEITRRDAFLKLLFGAGMVGLRSLATGIPASILLNPRRALAADAGAGEEGGAPPPVGQTQFVIFSSSGSGDPVNCNAPGTYGDPNIGHAADPSMASTPINFGGSSVDGAQIWSTLPASVLARTCFFHHGTYTVIHPDEDKVLGMMGAVASGEMLPSMLSRELAPTLGTVRAQPITLSGNANEAIYYQGAPQPLLTPTTLASVLSSPKNGLGTANLVALRDQGLDSLNALVKSAGTTAQKSFVDKYATSVTQLRTLQSSLLASLSAIKDNSQDSQIQTAIILFQMKVTPVVVVHVAFGGDNHGDPNLAGEVTGHQSGVASLATMMQELTAANMQNQVTFAMTNVFGRTMIAAKNTNGRGHNDTHHVSVLIGPRIKGGVIGGVAQPKAGAEYSALPIVSSTGAGSASGDIPFASTFGAMGQTLAAAVGLAPATIAANVLTGSVVNAALMR
jgi:Protein of unknown function (DUF1501)